MLASLFRKNFVNQTLCKSLSLYQTFEPPARAAPQWHQIFVLVEVLNKL